MDNIKIAVVANNAEDLLIRITSVFHKRGFKIKSFVFDETNSPDVVKMDITAVGECSKGEQMLRQLTKLYDIKEADLMAC
ncbi:MAG: ACT domain-containing protein [Anaerotignaceae bacterium]